MDHVVLIKYDLAREVHLAPENARTGAPDLNSEPFQLLIRETQAPALMIAMAMVIMILIFGTFAVRVRAMIRPFVIIIFFGMIVIRMRIMIVPFVIIMSIAPRIPIGFFRKCIAGRDTGGPHLNAQDQHRCE